MLTVLPVYFVSPCTRKCRQSFLRPKMITSTSEKIKYSWVANTNIYIETNVGNHSKYSKVYTMLDSVPLFALLRPPPPRLMAPCLWPPRCCVPPLPLLEERDNKSRMTAWRDAGDWECEGGDLFAGATSTFVIHLFNRDGDKHGSTTSGGQRGEEGKRRQPRSVTEASVNRLGR